MELIVLQSIVWLLRILVVLAPIFGFWWLIKHGVVHSKPRFPDWIYGISSGFRYQGLQAGFTGSLSCFGLLLYALWVGHTQRLEEAGAFLLPALMAGSIAFILGRQLFKTARDRRAYERTYEEGVRVAATVVGRGENSIEATPWSGETVYPPSGMAARGACLVNEGPWKVTIRFELDGQTIEDTRRVCSRVFYRFRNESSMPILVRPEEPMAWVPELERRPEREPTIDHGNGAASLAPSH